MAQSAAIGISTENKRAARSIRSVPLALWEEKKTRGPKRNLFYFSLAVDKPGLHRERQYDIR
jgi:hypothetical protein